MNHGTDCELERLETMTVADLLIRHREICGVPSASRHRRHLVRTLAWHLQAKAAGGLSPRAIRRAAELVEHDDLRVSTASGYGQRNGSQDTRSRRLPLPGTVIARRYKGRLLQVEVLANGFRFQNRTYKTLSEAARAITGSHWNGYKFFRLPHVCRKART